jgi:Putative DNA-binding domain
MSAPVMPPSFEQSFAKALLDPNEPMPAGLAGGSAQSAARRFGVHRNNMVLGLVKVIAARFPAVETIVGHDFFAAMARAFVVARPPRSPLLATYGDEFPDFIGTFEPAGELAYLADVARLEAARTRAYHAADAAPLHLDELSGLDADALTGLRIDLHPSLQIVRSAYPIVTIWAMNCGERELAPIESWSAEDALVVRPHLNVEVRLLPPGGAAFLQALGAGRPLREAADAALADHPAFDLTGNLAGMIGWGLPCGVNLSEPRGRQPS